MIIALLSLLAPSIASAEPLVAWSKYRVAEWAEKDLGKLGPDAAKLFMDNDVDGKLLAKFDAEDLAELAPHWTRIQKKKIISAIESLTDSTTDSYSMATETFEDVARPPTHTRSAPVASDSPIGSDSPLGSDSYPYSIWTYLKNSENMRAFSWHSTMIACPHLYLLWVWRGGRTPSSFVYDVEKVRNMGKVESFFTFVFCPARPFLQIVGDVDAISSDWPIILMVLGGWINTVTYAGAVIMAGTKTSSPAQAVVAICFAPLGAIFVECFIYLFNNILGYYVFWNILPTAFFRFFLYFAIYVFEPLFVLFGLVDAFKQVTTGENTVQTILKTLK